MVEMRLCSLVRSRNRITRFSFTKLNHLKFKLEDKSNRNRIIFLISHRLKWSILNQSQEITAKMKFLKTEYQDWNTNWYSKIEGVI